MTNAQTPMFHTDKAKLDHLISEAARMQVEHERDVGNAEKRKIASEADTALLAYWGQFDASLVRVNYVSDSYLAQKRRWDREMSDERSH